MCDWMNEVKEDLDESNGILTERSMRNTRRTEICCGHNIEYFSHNLTPETIVLFKEFCKKLGLNPNEVFDALE
jgi:hypothetical protein